MRSDTGATDVDGLIECRILLRRANPFRPRPPSQAPGKGPN